MHLREVTTYETDCKTFMKTLIYFQKNKSTNIVDTCLFSYVRAIRDLYRGLLNKLIQFF